jgi:hypothetical protein
MRKKHSLASQIVEYAAQRTAETPFCAKELLHLGSRAAIDQALSRLVRTGKLLRAGWGQYVRPIESRFGTHPPSAESVLQEVSKRRGETIASSGAAAANSLGLTTQVPLRMVYLTSGPSRKIKFGMQSIELRHAQRWELSFAGEPAGEAVRALSWLGPSQARAGLALLKKKLPEATLAQIAERRGTFPTWLAQSISVELVARG